VKKTDLLRSIRVGILTLSLTILPLGGTVFAQSNDNDNRPANARRDNDRDRDDEDFPWGLLGLLGLAGLLGLRKPKRDIYVNDRDMPPPRDVPPPRR
jgi:MYXO-CTERM domain-containing protein